MNNVDHYLIHAFDAAAAHVRSEIAARKRPGTETIYLSMLIQVSDPSWNAENVIDCNELARMGNIVACLGSPLTVEALQNDPRVLAIEASRPASDPDCVQSIPFINADVVRQRTNELGDGALIAIIDSDIDVLHEAFLDSSGYTRILAIWDQTDPTGPGPVSPITGKPYLISTPTTKNNIPTTEYKKSDIDNYIQNYAKPGSTPPSKRMAGAVRTGHGTHVASIAAGSPIPASNFPGGVAPEAKIIVVIPREAYGDTDPHSTGYSTSLVAALEYINDLAKSRNLPVVVNLSRGMNAGAHDGTSLVEAAFDNFTEGGRAPGRVVVKSAGNERGQDGHAKFSIASQQIISLTWSSPRSHDGMDVIELWFKACDEMKFRLIDPFGKSSSQITWSKRDEKHIFQSGSENEYNISYVKYHHDNGDSRLIITITPGNAYGRKILSGRWKLEIESGTIKSQGEVHAWIEKSNRIYFNNYLDDSITLTVPGTAHAVISVGSVGTSFPLHVSDRSGYGPTRDGREKPDLTAPGETIVAAEGNTSTGLIGRKGTSMAAPHVSGAIALLLSYRRKKIAGNPALKQLSTRQVQAAISQMTQNFNGRWNPDTGYGVLDVDKLISTFD